MQSSTTLRGTRFPLGSLALVALLLAPGCAKPEQPKLFGVQFGVKTDDGEPVAGAQFVSKHGPLGETSSDGVLEAQLRGHEGQTAVVQVSCPEDHRTSESQIRVPLQQVQALAGAQPRLPSYTATCVPTQRAALLLVRTTEAGSLPVTVNGQASGSTDDQGIKHSSYTLNPGAKVEVQLDTSAQPDLRPRNPMRTFTVQDEDSLFVFDQPFEREKKKAKIVRRAKPKPKPKRHIPKRL